MEKTIQTAPCKFCGQIIQIETEEASSETNAIEAATMQCKCAEAADYQIKRKRREKALKNVHALFGEGAAKEDRISDDVLEILKMAVELICDNQMEKITTNLWEGVKATISKNSKGEINVERTETKKQKLT